MGDVTVPMDKSRYPADWVAISLSIRERDGWKCRECGLANGAQIIRSSERPALCVILDVDTQCFATQAGVQIRDSEMPDEFDTSKQPTRVVLTVHHIGIEKPDGALGSASDKMDVRPDNLVSLCQRCHFLADLPGHIINAARSRKRKKEQAKLDAGQMPLFGGEE